MVSTTVWPSVGFRWRNFWSRSCPEEVPDVKNTGLKGSLNKTRSPVKSVGHHFTDTESKEGDPYLLKGDRVPTRFPGEVPVDVLRRDTNTKRHWLKVTSLECEWRENEGFRVSKKETRHDGLRLPPHHIRNGLTIRVGEVTYKRTIIHFWSVALTSGLKEPIILTPKNTFFNKLYHNDMSLLTTPKLNRWYEIEEGVQWVNL